MPRGARRLSSTGIYHVMLRGINRQRIFEDREDCDKFLGIFAECKQISGFGIYAYCLMGNHVHLLMKEGPEQLGHIFKRIGARYVFWYNRKYKRNGPLFQDRFKSEPVHDDSYLMTVIRYIHQNPVKAGLCDDISHYPYSSYMSYLQPERKHLADTDFVLSIVEKDEFVKFSLAQNDDKCLEQPETAFRLNDEQLSELLYKVTKCRNTAEFQALDVMSRDKYLRQLRGEGLSIREVSRVTGVSVGIVRRF